MDPIPQREHAEMNTSVPSGCRGVLAAQPPHFTLQTLPCPSLPSCHPCYFLAARRGMEPVEPGPPQQTEVSPSVFNAPATGAGQGGGLQVSLLQGVVGKEGCGAHGGKLGAMLELTPPAEVSGLTWHLLLGRAWNSPPSRAAWV